MDLLSLIIRAVELVQSVDKHVDTLVLPLVSSADSHQYCILCNRLTAHCLGNFDELAS